MMRIKFGENLIQPREVFTPTSLEIEGGVVTAIWDDVNGTWLSPEALENMVPVSLKVKA